MKIITNEEDFEKAKSRDLIKLECEFCNKQFNKEKHYIKAILNGSYKTKGKFCSKECGWKAQKIGLIYNCSNCNKEFYRTPSEIKHKKRKSNRLFCSSSCAATYNNIHKKHGHRRSKLEKWLEIRLIELYPNLEINFNKKDAINSELDIYIPSIKLAFELNGIFHYEPIYGKEQLNKIQNNDNRKFQACLEKQIELCIIDTSKLSYFKEKNIIPFLEIIKNIINNKIGASGNLLKVTSSRL